MAKWSIALAGVALVLAGCHSAPPADQSAPNFPAKAPNGKIVFTKAPPTATAVGKNAKPGTKPIQPAKS